MLVVQHSEKKKKVLAGPLLFLLCVICSQPVYPVQFLLTSNLSGTSSQYMSETEASSPGFEVWLYEEISLQASVQRSNVQRSDFGTSMDLCINSGSARSPAHLTISIEPALIDPEIRSQTRYSFAVEGQEAWRNERDFFDYLVHSSDGCSSGKKFEFRYKAVTMGAKSLGRSTFADTITLTISPE